MIKLLVILTLQRFKFCNHFYGTKAKNCEWIGFIKCIMAVFSGEETDPLKNMQFLVMRASYLLPIKNE